jgi:hypothetical protein
MTPLSPLVLLSKPAIKAAVVEAAAAIFLSARWAPPALALPSVGSRYLTPLAPLSPHVPVAVDEDHQSHRIARNTGAVVRVGHWAKPTDRGLGPKLA